MTNLYILSRKIHRILVIIITFLTVLMAGTGTVLKYSFVAAKLTFIDLGLIRYIHNQISPFFTITLVFMMLTGIFMYIFPLLKKKPSPPQI